VRGEQPVFGKRAAEFTGEVRGDVLTRRTLLPG
jgi:hypothetical protein